MQVTSTSYNRAHHWFAVFVACATLLLIVAGALVTSNDAALSVPDWPTSFGSLSKIPKLVGGVKFEHTHRMVAEFVGVLKLWDAYKLAHEELTQSKLRGWCEKRFLGFLRMREWRELHRQLDGALQRQRLKDQLEWSLAVLEPPKPPVEKL